MISLLIGLLLLVAGAELLVSGGGQLALALRVPALVVGLTVVAFGTSAPELLVSVTAAMNASTSMALGNVIGSNIANIILVLGLSAMVAPLMVDRMLMRREVPVAVGLQLLVPLLALDGELSRIDGVIFIAGGVGYNVWLLYESLRGRAPAAEDSEKMPAAEVAKNLMMLIGGLGILVGGAQLFVSGAQQLAYSLDLSQRFVGLTVVALGTSAPEVVTGMVSARRGEVDLAVGNSLGSNILNISMVLGITAVIMPIEVGSDGAMNDLGIAALVTCLLIPIVLKGSISRVEGGLLASGYVLYVFVGYLTTQV
ncbi:MAG: calcium/sodium antiporter [Rhodobacterales bacterium]|nr:calcium/sodium antiporter [Rhodobacterales bacterium]